MQVDDVRLPSFISQRHHRVHFRGAASGKINRQQRHHRQQQRNGGEGDHVGGRRSGPGLRRVREGGSQRPLPVRLGPEVQEVPRGRGVAASPIPSRRRLCQKVRIPNLLAQSTRRTYWAEKLPTGIAPGPVTEAGTSSTHVLPGVSGIWWPAASRKYVGWPRPSPGRHHVPETQVPNRQTSAAPLPRSCGTGWWEPLGSSIHQLRTQIS